jgi:hypothetical protein
LTFTIYFYKRDSSRKPRIERRWMAKRKKVVLPLSSGEWCDVGGSKDPVKEVWIYEKEPTL